MLSAATLLRSTGCAAGGIFSVPLSVRSYPARALPGALPSGVRTFLPASAFGAGKAGLADSGSETQRSSGWLRLLSMAYVARDRRESH